VVEGAYTAALTGFGVPARVAVPAIATYRAAQYLMPIALGGLAYASLRVGPWKIEKRDRLVGLRDLARSESARGETKIDFALRFGGRRPIGDPELDPAIAATLRHDTETDPDSDVDSDVDPVERDHRAGDDTDPDR
jgi:hypothetical protein